MSVGDATKKFLGMCGRRAQAVEQIHAALTQGGLQVNKESLFTILPRVAKGREIVKVGRGLWGLAEWYDEGPRRTRKLGRPRRNDDATAQEKVPE